MGTMGRRRNELDTEDGIGRTTKLTRKKLHKVKQRLGIRGQTEGRHEAQVEEKNEENKRTCAASRKM